MYIFEKQGPVNTEKTLEIALEAAQSRGIKHIIVASNTGETVKKLLDMDVKDVTVICVSLVYGYYETGKQTMPEETRRELEERGVRIIIAAHMLSGGERAFSRAFGGIGPVEAAAKTLMMFGRGTKAGVEAAVMATDCGAIPYGEPVVVVAGTSRGADTAMILRPAYTASFLDTRIDEMLCKAIVPGKAQAGTAQPGAAQPGKAGGKE